MIEDQIESLGAITRQKIAEASNELREEIAGQGDKVERQCKDILDLLENEVSSLGKEFTEQLNSEIEKQQAEHRTEVDALKAQLIEQNDAIAGDFNERLNAEIERQQTIHGIEIDSIREQLADRKDVDSLIENIDTIKGELEQHRDLEQELTERIASIKDGERGEQGIQGEPGADGQDRQLLEPVEIVNKDYPKNTLGTHDGGLWISTKQTVGDPETDPHGWHCILDAVKDMGIDLEPDGRYKLSVRMATGRVMAYNFDIPYPEHKGIWEEGEYTKGSIVTKGSCFWQAIDDTSGAPPGNGWRQILSAPRGKAGPAGKSIEGPQGKPGRNATLDDEFIADLREIVAQYRGQDV